MSKAIQRPSRVEHVRGVTRLARRWREGHKGDYGHVLVVGGSRGMAGAVALAAQSALRGGAGLVTFAAPEAVQLTIAAMCPCATSIALSCDREGEPDAGAARQVLQAAGAVRQVLKAAGAGASPVGGRGAVLAVGPGMGVGGGQRNLVRAALGQERPLVLDADGLNNLAKIDGWPELRRCPMVLTPHPGEFSRLTGKKVAEVQADRIGSAVAAAREWGGARLGATDQSGATVLREAEDRADRGARCTVLFEDSQGRGTAARGASLRRHLALDDMPLVLVLKGAGTVVTDGRRVYVNTTGNPGMATGGSGDVLTGLVAALIGQGLSPFDAACLGVYVHGLAGDMGAKELGEVSLTAWDLIGHLPGAMKTVTTRR